MATTLNERAQRLADFMASMAAPMRIHVQTTGAGARVLDCGINAPGGIQTGLDQLANGVQSQIRPRSARFTSTTCARPGGCDRSTTRC